MAYATTLWARSYDVAILAAIELEYVILCALLDERHNDPFDRLEDDRLYTCGRINQHNVVIARLPAGTVGIDAAASVAADLANSFRSLRFGLMVGIAGGAPSAANDIRLGDIVVSVPADKDRAGGVIQYDFGASKQDHGIVRRGCLNRPPLVLLNAIGELQARYASDGHNLEEAVEQLIQGSRSGRLRAYRKPSNGQDLLFMSDFVHAHESSSCSEVGCNLQENKIIQRTRRESPMDQCVIHLGNIGSGGLLMRDAVLRDRIAGTDGVKCFEMESAGLMNSRIPWLVIRGISDYSDSHKNDEWQKYAAAIAAVYAKELLATVRCTAVKRTEQVQESKDGLVAHDLFRFLEYERMDYKRQFAMPEESFDLEWVWTTRLKDWLSDSTSNEPFWVSGKPGSGKSTLMAHLSSSRRTRQLLADRNGTYQILHFFYDYRAGANLANNLEGMLRMFLYQLAMNIDDIQKFLHQDLRRRPQQYSSPTLLLERICEVLNRKTLRTCIFIDGLDEYQGNHVELLQICRMLLTRTTAKLCIASRPEVPVEQILRIYSKIALQDHNTASMRSYATESILAAGQRNISIKKMMTPDFQQALILKAEGIILWFKLAFDEALKLCQDGSDTAKIGEFLESIPIGLDEMYQRILSLLPEAHLNECALLVLMVREFQQGAEAAKSSMMTLLDHFWGAYDFLSIDSETYLGKRPLLSLKDFQDHLKDMLRGLIECGTTSEGFLDVRFIHKTFAAFVDKSNWIEDNLSSTFKQKYPDSFQLRLYSLMIRQAASENVVSPQQCERCLRDVKHVSIPHDSRRSMRMAKFSIALLRSVPLLNARTSLLLGIVSTITDARGSLKRDIAKENHIRWILTWCMYCYLCLGSSRYTIPPNWQIRRTALQAAIEHLCTLGRCCEAQGGSVSDIISPTFHTTFDIVIAADHFEWIIELPFQSSSTRKTILDNFHLFLLLHGGLIETLLNSLAELDMSLDLRVLLLHSIIRKHDDKHFTNVLPRLLDRIISDSAVIRYQHICNILSATVCLQEAANVAGCLLPYLQCKPQVIITSGAPKASQQFGNQGELLLRWGQRPVGCFQDPWGSSGYIYHETTHEDRNFYHELLGLLIAYGVDINEPCYSGGTVLHAILDMSFINQQGKKDIHLSLKMTLQKLKALASEGIDATIRNKRGYTALRVALESKNKLLRKWPENGDWEAITQTFDSIIQRLQLNESTGSWDEA